MPIIKKRSEARLDASLETPLTTLLTSVTGYGQSAHNTTNFPRIFFFFFPFSFVLMPKTFACIVRKS